MVYNQTDFEQNSPEQAPGETLLSPARKGRFSFVRRGDGCSAAGSAIADRGAECILSAEPAFISPADRTVQAAAFLFGAPRGRNTEQGRK